MDSAKPRSDTRKLIAFVLPMSIFISLLGLGGAVKKPGAGLWLSAPEQWIYPAQTFLCGAALLYFWREYEIQRARKVWVAVAIAVAVFLLWIAPQQFLGFTPRIEGFNPDIFAERPSVYWSVVALRFLRLVLVVPLVEEIFWRGFLLRYLISERFTTVAVGTFSWLSFGVVTLAFGFAHSRADWIAALLCGALYNFVAWRTRNLASCVIAHAATNLLLGVWIMQTRQWGFW
jgi:CAAX prenyl protease-like protein